jgi:hypothetical protein
MFVTASVTPQNVNNGPSLQNAKIASQPTFNSKREGNMKTSSMTSTNMNSIQKPKKSVDRQVGGSTNPQR